MVSRLRHVLSPGHLLAAAATAVPVVVVLFGSRVPLDSTPGEHFWPVLVGAGVAAFVSAWLSLAGARARDGRTLFLGIAFSTMAALLAVHGFATPGVVAGPNGVIALAGGISIPVGAALLALTALPGLRRPRRIKPL